jgi:5-deoxy-glucuronate isomerase
MVQTNELTRWKIQTPPQHGFHMVASPETGLTKSLWVYRLNLRKNETYTFSNEKLEMEFAVIRGSATIRIADKSYKLKKLDSFYVPSKTQVEMKAEEDLFLYAGGAADEGYGDVFVHSYNPDLPVGAVRQIHGREPYRRDVYMTLGPDVPASRLICGWTWSDTGAWSSWPPHQHEKDLEEAYCYFDMDSPAFGIHISYLNSGKPTNACIVQTGDVVLAPKGYHPTVSSPANKNSYFWILAAHSHTSRRYDLAVNDPAYDK